MGKRTILGCFSAIGSSRFPTDQFPMAIYIVLTDGRGNVPVKVQLVDAGETRPPIFVAEGEVEFKYPGVAVELDLHLSGVELPEPGEYRLQLYAGHELLLQRRILVTDTSGGPANDAA